MVLIKRRLRTIATALAFTLLLGATMASAQTPPDPPPDTSSETSGEAPDQTGAAATGETAPPTDEAPETQLAEEIEQLTARLEADSALDQAGRTAIAAELQRATELLRQRDASEQEAASLSDAARTAPERLERLRAELATPPAPIEIAADESMSLDAVREAAQKARTDLTAARNELQRFQTEATNRLTRLDEIPREVEDLQGRLAELADVIEEGTNGLPLDQAARRVRRLAERELIQAQIDRIQTEMSSYRARQDLLPIRRDLAQRRVDRVTEVAAQWQKLETDMLRRQAAAVEREALRQQMEAALLADPLQVVAQQTADFAARRAGPDGTVELLTRARDRLSEIRDENAELQSRVLSTHAKIQAAGLSDAVGVVLRNEMLSLPRTQPLRDERDDLRDEISDAQYMLIVTDEKLSKISDIEAAVPRLVAEVDLAAADASDEAIASAARDLLTSQREVLVALRGEYSTFIEVGTDLDTALREWQESVSAYRTFIEERILWTRSVPGRRLPRWRDIVEAARWLVSSSEWGTVASSVFSGLAPPSIRSLVIAAVFALSLVLVRVANRRISALAEQVRRFSTDRFGLTILAFLLTVLTAIRWPLLIQLIASLVDPSVNELADALETTLIHLSRLLFILEVIRAALRPGGLVEVHFRWSKPGVADLRRHVLILEVALLPLTAIYVLLGEQGNELSSDALGRLAFVLSMIATAVIYARALAPWRPFASAYYARRPKGALSRARWPLYATIVGLPLLMGCVATVGYYYTALEIDRRLQYTSVFILLVALCYSFVLRWLFLARRRLIVDRAQQKREASIAAGETGEGQPSEQDQQLDVPDIDTQTRRVIVAAVVTILVIGMYGLWADILPALRMLERVQVWPTITLLEDGNEGALPEVLRNVEAAPDAPGSGMPMGGLSLLEDTASGPSVPMLENAVTVDEVLLALIVLLLTLVLSRNLPGLLEITLLRHLPIDAGARFAVAAVMRYVIAVVGILVAFSVLGIGWTKVQWLVAALTFGLAFGLQEIFANFISGLIILGERPIRVGDTVTVGGVNGTVTQIRMRATTVRDWTLKELIIPNKVFITDQVVNWTLSDPRIRVDIAVGVSYGADVRLAQETLLELGRTEPHVLADPVPRSLFLSFGDSTLDFELRVYLDHFDYFIEARSSLHMRIIERFRELGIEIAFPQRDLHVRSIDPSLPPLLGRGD